MHANHGFVVMERITIQGTLDDVLNVPRDQNQTSMVITVRRIMTPLWWSKKTQVIWLGHPAFRKNGGVRTFGLLSISDCSHE